MKILETERLFIREFTEDDITNMHKIYSNPNVMQFIGDGLPFCFKQTSAFIQKMVQRYKRDGFSFWAVLNKKNGEILGHCGLMKHRESQKVEIGYLIQESSQKQGFAFEVSQAVLYYAFHNLSLQEVVAFTKWNNLPSQNLMKKLGMKHWKNYFKDGIEYTAYSITKDYYFEIGH